VHSGDTDLLAAVGAVLGGHHSGVGRRLIAISLNLHSSGHTADGFLSRQISDVNKGIVEGSVDTRNTEDELVGEHVLGTIGDHLFGGGGLRGGLSFSLGSLFISK
jgi:hypothetical protein